MSPYPREKIDSSLVGIEKRSGSRCHSFRVFSWTAARSPESTTQRRRKKGRRDRGSRSAACLAACCVLYIGERDLIRFDRLARPVRFSGQRFNSVFESGWTEGARVSGSIKSSGRVGRWVLNSQFEFDSWLDMNLHCQPELDHTGCNHHAT